MPEDLNAKITEVMQDVYREYAKYTEMLAAAYMKHTHISPDECEAVIESRCSNDGGIEYITYYRKRTARKEPYSPIEDLILFNK